MPALRIIIALCLALHPFARADQVLPLQKGNYWVYKAEISRPDQTGKGKVETFTFRMEVLSTVSGQGFFAALVDGFPVDCIFNDPSNLRRQHVIVSQGESLLILSDGAWDYVRRGILPPLSLDGQLYTIPLKVSPAPGDGWIMEDTGPFDPSGLKGATDRKDLRLLLVHDPANASDSLSISLVPGIGIVRYTYRPGFTSNCDLRLIEFGHANRPGGR